MLDHAVEWCNSLNRSYERACARSRQIGCEGDEYEDLLTLRAVLACRREDYREQIARAAAPWFEVMAR